MSHIKLPTPARKSNNTFNREYPFPIIRSSCNNGESDPKWNCVVGYLQEDSVVVHDIESMRLLYSKGFFGKGTLSKNAPKVCFKDTKDEVKIRLPVEELEDDVIDVDAESPKPSSCSKPDEDEIVLLDSNASNGDGNIQEISHSKEDSCDEEESLQLTFEEAYYLSYALGCLVVKDMKNQPIDLIRLWNKFCEASIENNFPVMYTAYHHFRSKGWIVKPGVKYSVDYVLYKDGPPFYHATYSVIVKPVKEQNFRDARNSRQMTWASLFALNRLSNSVGKALMFLYVIKPSAVSENKISTPFCISQFKLEEVLFQRWVAAENREESS